MGYGGSTSKRTHNMIRAMAKVDKYLAMTGTLIDGKLSSAYPSIHVINPLYYGSYEGFMMEHAITDDYGNVVVEMAYFQSGKGRVCTWGLINTSASMVQRAGGNDLRINHQTKVLVTT